MSDELENLSFEEAFGELEITVQRLDAPPEDLMLQEAITLYERGMRLAQRCTDALDAAELQVHKLTRVSNQQQLGMLFEEE
ncbi:MAG: exodeoxyribonuclease VII small subunit [Anaerolineae bacterium]|jgi:exodeoxyribonuclease VII small subunit